MEKDGFPGFYDTSSAGHIPAGEDYLESAVRELAAVYLYWEPVAISQMTLQKEKVESVIWIDYEECLKRMEAGTLKHCVNVEEFRHIPLALKRYGK